MIYPYHYTKADHLEAIALQKANSRQSSGVLHLILMLGVGCIVYLNMATLRHAFDRNDSVSFAVAIVVTALLLINYSPKIMPALIFAWKSKFHDIPSSLIGPHELEINDKYLAFHSQGTETRVVYTGLARVNHNSKIVLFYLMNGVVEAVPLRALGSTPDDCTEVLTLIETLSRKANEKKKSESLPVWKPEADFRFSCSITQEDVLTCNGFLVREERSRRLRMPIHWLYLLIILLCVAGCAVGLAQWGAYTPSLRIFQQIFYILEIPGCLIAILFWYRPLAMVNYAMVQNFKLGQYPIGYFSDRHIEWDRESFAFRYGVFGLCLDWDSITHAYDLGNYLYLYQGDTLVLFLPKAGKEEEIKKLSEKITVYQLKKISEHVIYNIGEDIYGCKSD